MRRLTTNADRVDMRASALLSELLTPCLPFDQESAQISTGCRSRTSPLTVLGWHVPLSQAHTIVGREVTNSDAHRGQAGSMWEQNGPGVRKTDTDTLRFPFKCVGALFTPTDKYG